MGGLLTRAIGGAMQGAGAAMVDQAKAAREDALAAIKRGQEVDDRQAGYAQQDKTVATQEAGANQRSADTNQTSRDDTASNNATSITVGAANNKTTLAAAGMAQAGENTRQGNLIEANKKAAETAAGRYGKPEADQNGNLIATNQNGKAITIVGADGKSIMAPNSKIPGTAMKIIADKSVDADGNFDMPTFMANMQQAEKVYGPGGQTAALPPPTAPATGYLGKLWGSLTGSPDQGPAAGNGLVRTPDSKSVVGAGAQPPAGFKQGSDGGYYAPDPQRPGKFLKWTP